MDKPLVTVITPTYNCRWFIEENIVSVMTQDYDNLEHIVIDDASTDGTGPVLSGIESYDKIKLITHKCNHGEQATVNEGLALVKGKYFIILNADDLLYYSAINKLVSFMEAHPDVLCAYPDWDCINEDGSLKFHHQTREYDFSWMVAHQTWLPSVGSIFRSDVIKLIGYRDTSYRYLGDADYWLRIGLAGKMARVPETLAAWRYRDGQASQDKSDVRAKEHIRIMREFYSKYHHNLRNVRGQAVCWSYVVAASVAKSKRLVVSCVFNAVKSYPQLLISLGFWHILAIRAFNILRR